MNLKKVLVIALFVACLPFWVVMGIYLGADVDRLKSEYPVWKHTGKDEREIIWKDKRPRHWKKLSQISKLGQWAIVLSEDWAFYTHDGFDFNQLEKVVDESLKKGELTRGASTISQQLVKNVFLTNERSLWRKFKEWIITVKLEKNFKKRDILEAYLNIIELGPKVYGIENGSWYYFSKPAANLTAREGAFLAMLLPSPIRYGESFRKKELTKFALQIVNRNLLHLKMAHQLSKAQYEAALGDRFYWEQNAYQLADEDVFNEDSYGQDKERLLRSLKDLETGYEETPWEETPSDLDTREQDPEEDLSSPSQKSDTNLDETEPQMPSETDDSQKNTFENDPDLGVQESPPTSQTPEAAQTSNSPDQLDEPPSPTDQSRKALSE